MQLSHIYVFIIIVNGGKISHAFWLAKFEGMVVF